MDIENNPVILFDGVCNLCNGAVQFVIKHDANKQFRFASLQSEFGQKILLKNGFDTESLKSFILIENNKIYTKSTAALRVAKKLNAGWPLLYGFIIIPSFIRNGVYNFIAKNRYKWFGKQDACWMPTPDLKSRFIN